MSVQQYLQIRAAHATATACAQAKAEEVAFDFGTNRWDDSVRQHPGVLALEAEATRLYREADALTPHMIRANLHAFGLEDPEVIGVLTGRDSGREIGRSEPVALSELCGLRHSGLAQKLGLNLEQVELSIQIRRDGVPIGRVDCDGRFRFEAAPVLRTALGWVIATDGGRGRLVDFSNLDQAALALLYTITNGDTERTTFFGSFSEVLKRVIVYERTSRFSDGYCGALTVLWQVATRELGQKHEGFSFCY